MIGTLIDGFIVRQELGRGGMGTVYLAEHERLTGWLAVVKLISAELMDRADARARFEREALAAAQLRHRRILAIDGFGSLHDGHLWLRMRYLRGCSLRAYLAEQGAVSLHVALRIMLQVSAALDHAHRSGVIHRDVKPDNIFIDPTEDDPWAVKLLDWGIAKFSAQRDARTRTGSCVGTPCYMSVEAYEGPRGVSGRSDVYSSAIVAHELVTGRRPWDVPFDVGAGVLYHLQKTTRPELHVPAWNDVLATALAVRPDDRYDSARAFALALALATPAGDRVTRDVAPELLRGDQIVCTGPRDLTLRADHWDPTALRVAADVVALPPPPPARRGGLSLRYIALAIVVCMLAATVTFTVVRGVRGVQSTATPDAGLAAPRN